MQIGHVPAYNAVIRRYNTGKVGRYNSVNLVSYNAAIVRYDTVMKKKNVLAGNKPPYLTDLRTISRSVATHLISSYEV